MVLKVTVDDGVAERLFLADGNSVVYERTDIAESRPVVLGTAWARKVRTQHTISWETVSYE